MAAFEIPLPSEADREQFLAILRTAAAAEGMHVDVESKQDLENAARASPLLEMTMNAAVWKTPTGYIVKPSEAHKYQLTEREKQPQGDFPTGKYARTPDIRNQPTFDETRGVILEGDAARELVEQCGGTTESNRLSSADINHVDQELAPLLEADLKRAGSGATPQQYYRQYAAGGIGKWDATFVNGFHESYFRGPSATAEYATWRHRPVSVSDGGTHYWCAIYSKGIKGHIVRFKNKAGAEGPAHVAFHGLG